MKNKYYSLFSLFFVLFISTSLTAQTFVDHNTTRLRGSIFSNGLIGHDGGFTVGNGVKYLAITADAMYTSGIMLGTSSQGVSGHIGSFSINTDMTVVTPISAFSSNAQFNQIATATFNDNGAPVANRKNVSVFQTSYSNTNDDFIIVKYDVTNNGSSALNGLYIGVSADWDVGEVNYNNNLGGHDAARKLAYQYLATGTINDPNYYGIVCLSALGGMSVTLAGTSAAIRTEAYQFMTNTNYANPTGTGDYRTFIGSGPFNVPVGQTVSAAFAVVAGTDLANLQLNSELAQAKYNNHILPVELTSFSASLTGNNVNLQWATASEINNLGFEVQRKIINGNESSEWNVIGFKEGNGTTTTPQDYLFVDDISSVNATSIQYRLKQVDFDGTFEYSETVFVENFLPSIFSLSQNFPNPFNPSTKINYSLPTAEFVNISVYNLLGEKVAVLVNELKEAGNYEINFNASELTSGIYLYKIEAGSFVQTNKMTLLR